MSVDEPVERESRQILGRGPAAAHRGKATAYVDTEHELVAGNLISKDGRTAGFLVTLAVKPEQVQVIRNQLTLLEERRQARQALTEAKTGAERELATRE